MRFVLVVIYVFAVFAFLTMGSLFVIVSLHVLTMEDALLKVQEVYENPWLTLRMGASGIMFLVMGLIFSKILVKETWPTKDMVLLGKWGYVSVSTKAIHDVANRCLKKFDFIVEKRIKVHTNGNRLNIAVQTTVASNLNVSELTDTVQAELYRRVNLLLGDGVALDIAIQVRKIVDQPKPLATVPS